MGPKPRKGISPFLPFLLFLLFLFPPPVTSINELEPANDLEPLLALKSSIDPSNHLPWSRSSSSNLCTSWKGIKECTPRGRVTKLILEFLNLTGPLPSQLLAPLDQLRVLSFKSNSLSGALPDLTPLINLKTLYLNDNHFTGRIPASLSSLHRLKILVLSENLLSGAIPGSLTSLPRLYTLYLQNNRLSGKIPIFNQPSLQYLNLSNNDLSGEIPQTRTLSQFNISSFSNNPSLCGPQIGLPCSKNPIFPPSVSPEPGVSSPILTSPLPPTSKRSKTKRVLKIVAISIAGVIFLAICLGSALLLAKKKKRKTQQTASRSANIATRATDKATGGGEERGAEAGDKNGGGFSWEGEGLGRLVFCGGVGEMYSLEELLKASAETLGRGTVGSTYKAVMESGFIVTVKRLKDSGSPGAEEFRRRMEEIGRLRHPNLVPLRAYFQAREERLLVYDYFPNGSLFSLIHGSRPSGSGKPLHWTSCLKIAEDVATGLLYLHQAPAVHGNLKSSNVLLGSDFESCLTDYCLIPSLLLSNPDSTSTSSATALFYRAPECRIPKPLFAPASDVYSFGVLLLELLTGKTPFQDLVEEHGADIPQWVRSVREEETESGGDDPSSGNEIAMPAASAEEKVGALLNIAMACVATEAERRPAMKDVVRMIREARAEVVVVVVSSNSSDHSPGRWSDTVQSLPREYGSESFAERD